METFILLGNAMIDYLLNNIWQASFTTLEETVDPLVTFDLETQNAAEGI